MFVTLNGQEAARPGWVRVTAHIYKCKYAVRVRTENSDSSMLLGLIRTRQRCKCQCMRLGGLVHQMED